MSQVSSQCQLRPYYDMFDALQHEPYHNVKLRIGILAAAFLVRIDQFNLRQEIEAPFSI